MKAKLNENLIYIENKFPTPLKGYVVVDETIPRKWYVDDTCSIREVVVDDDDYWEKRPEYKNVLLTIGFKLKGVPYAMLENEVEFRAWNNPCLSRKDVYELFHKVFGKMCVSGECPKTEQSREYKISASKEVHEFDKQLRELAMSKQIEIDTLNPLKTISEIEFETTSHFVSDPICVEEWDQLKIIPDSSHSAGMVVIKNIALL